MKITKKNLEKPLVFLVVVLYLSAGGYSARATGEDRV